MPAFFYYRWPAIISTGHSSVRNGLAGRSAELYRLHLGLGAQAYRTTKGFLTCELGLGEVGQLGLGKGMHHLLLYRLSSDSDSQLGQLQQPALQGRIVSACGFSYNPHRVNTGNPGDFEGMWALN
ncbi:MAG: hypothetical protein AMJ65_04470 [Phycisphaerae bacterium SG8_4]|nr:MAG: hypothetical protein AMJ65_04470 [Phycisphaerae bacterium SG8_4]